MKRKTEIKLNKFLSYIGLIKPKDEVIKSGKISFFLEVIDKNKKVIRYVFILGISILILILSIQLVRWNKRITHLERRISRLELNEPRYATREHIRERAEYVDLILNRIGHMASSVVYLPNSYDWALGLTTYEIDSIFYENHKELFKPYKSDAEVD